eukprot:scaffold121045_cov54-Phaeocystis_antarctica.AAC.3
MAVAGPTFWGSGAIRRRQRPPDDTGSSQSCPGVSEHTSIPARACPTPASPYARATTSRARTRLVQSKATISTAPSPSTPT